MESIRKNIRTGFIKLLEGGNYPAGAENDANAPWTGKDKDHEHTVPKGSEEPFRGIYYNGEICILQNSDKSLWVFYDGAMLNKDESYKLYAAVGPEGEFDITPAVIARYINDNLGLLKKGEGTDAWENGVDIVKIDPELSSMLRVSYKEEKLRNILLSLS